MARPLKERVFDPSQPLVVAKPFIAAGRHYQPGDAFDWKRLSVNQRRVRNMFDIRLVDYVKEEKAPEPKKAEAVEVKKTETAGAKASKVKAPKENSTDA